MERQLSRWPRPVQCHGAAGTGYQHHKNCSDGIERLRDASLSHRDGAAIPKYTKEENEWLFERADQSIDFYYLNEGNWVADREDIMKAVSSICDQLVSMKKQDSYDQAEYDQALDDLAEYLDPYSDFTSADEQAYKEKAIGI